MDWRRASRPRGFGDVTWRQGGAAEAASPPRPAARTPARPPPGGPFGAKFKAAPATLPPKPAAKTPRPYTPTGGGTIPDIFLPKFGAKFAGKVKPDRNVTVAEADTESVKESVNIPDTTPPLSLENSSSLYDITDNTDASVPLSITPDSYGQRDDQQVPPMFTTGHLDLPEQENEMGLRGNKSLLTSQTFEEEEEDYTAFVQQQQRMMLNAKERAQRAVNVQRNPLVDDYEIMQKQFSRKAAPFGDYIKNQESESETFYTPNVSMDNALNKFGKTRESNLPPDARLARPAKTIDPNRDYDVKGLRKRNTPVGRRSFSPENEAAYEEEEFLSAFSEQSVRKSAVFIPQKHPLDMDDEDSPLVLAGQEKEWRAMKGRKDTSPLPFTEELENKGRRSKTPRMKSANVNEMASTKLSKQRGRDDQSDSESLEEITFQGSKIKNRDLIDSKGRHSKTPPKSMKQRGLQDEESDDRSLEDATLEEPKAKGREVASPTVARHRESMENKGRRSTTPDKMNAVILDGGVRTKTKKRSTLQDDERVDPTAKKKQHMEPQESKKNRRADVKWESDSASEDSVRIADSNKTKKKGNREYGRKKMSSEDEHLDEHDAVGKSMSPKMKKGGSQKTSSRSTTPSRASRTREGTESHSEESDATPKHKSKQQFSDHETEISKSKSRAGQKPRTKSRKTLSLEVEDDHGKLKSDVAARKHGKLVQPDDDGNMSKPKAKSTRIQKDNEQNLNEALDSTNRSKAKSQTRKRATSSSPKYLSSADELKSEAAAKSKRKKHVQPPPSDRGSSESLHTDDNESATEQKVKKGFRKQTLAAVSRSPGHDSDSAKVSTSASVLDSKVTPKLTHNDESDEDDRSRSLSSAEDSTEHKPRRGAKGKSRLEGQETENDSTTTLPGSKVKKRPRNELHEASSESNLSSKDEEMFSDEEESAANKKSRKQKKVATDSDHSPSEKPKYDKRSKSKSPSQRRHSYEEDSELDDEPKVNKHGRREPAAVAQRHRSPGRKLVSDDSLRNVVQKVEKQSRRMKPDTSSFPSSDQTQTELDEDGSLIANKTKGKKAGAKGTKGKIKEQLLTEKRTDKHSKTHGKKELRSPPIPAEQKSKKNSKDTSPKTVSRGKKPSKQTTLKATAEDTKVKHKSKGTSEKLALKKTKSESDSSETSESKIHEKSASDSEEEQKDKGQSHEKKASESSRRKKHDKDLSETETELMKSTAKVGDKGSAESSGKKMKPVKAFSEVPSNAKKDDNTGNEEKIFPIKMQTIAFEQQASATSIFASQHPKPAADVPGAMTQTTPSLVRKFMDEEAGVQSEDFVNLSKQRLPTTSSVASNRQFSPKESLPQFRESLRKFLSKDVQTPVAKRIQTTPSIGLSEESVTWEEYNANLMPKYTEKVPRDRDKKKHSKSIGIQQSVRKLESDDSTTAGTETSECNVRHSWLDDVLKQLQSIAEDKRETSAEESSPDERTQADISEEESIGGYSLYRGAEDMRKFQYAPCSDTSFDPRRQPTEESVYTKIPQTGSSIATVCPDPDKFVQVINISMLPSRIVAVEVTQDIGDGTTPPPSGKLEFDEPTTALTFNVPLLEPCQGDHHPVTNQHGKAWPQASTQRPPVPVNMPHEERMRKPAATERSVKVKDSSRSGSVRRQRGATTRHQHLSSVDENPRQQRPDASNQRNQLSPADILLSRLAQRLAWKSQ